MNPPADARGTSPHGPSFTSTRHPRRGSPVGDGLPSGALPRGRAAAPARRVAGAGARGHQRGRGAVRAGECRDRAGQRAAMWSGARRGSAAPARRRMADVAHREVPAPRRSRPRSRRPGCVRSRLDPTATGRVPAGRRQPEWAGGIPPLPRSRSIGGMPVPRHRAIRVAWRSPSGLTATTRQAGRLPLAARSSAASHLPPPGDSVTAPDDRRLRGAGCLPSASWPRPHAGGRPHARCET